MKEIKLILTENQAAIVASAMGHLTQMQSQLPGDEVFEAILSVAKIVMNQMLAQDFDPTEHAYEQAKAYGSGKV